MNAALIGNQWSLSLSLPLSLLGYGILSTWQSMSPDRPTGAVHSAAMVRGRRTVPRNAAAELAPVARGPRLIVMTASWWVALLTNWMLVSNAPL